MAKYGVVETTKLLHSQCYDFQMSDPVENGTVLTKGDLLPNERLIYQGVLPATATLATAELYLVANPAWNYDDSRTTNQNEENFINEANHAFRVYDMKMNDLFKVSDYTIDPINGSTPLAEGQFVGAQNASGKLKAFATAPTAAFVGKIIKIDQVGFPFAVGSAGTVGGVTKMVLIEVVRNSAVENSGD